jgi:hypothetical protein
MKILRKTLSVIFLVFLFSGCSKDKCTEPETEISIQSFSDIEEKVFTPSCATSGCHSGQNPSVGLNLEAGQAYANIYEIPSIQNPQLNLIKAGESDQSYLLLKMNDQGQGQVMPTSGKLDKPIRDAVAAWIDAGAVEN